MRKIKNTAVSGEHSVSVKITSERIVMTFEVADDAPDDPPKGHGEVCVVPAWAFEQIGDIINTLRAAGDEEE